MVLPNGSSHTRTVLHLKSKKTTAIRLPGDLAGVKKQYSCVCLRKALNTLNAWLQLGERGWLCDVKHAKRPCYSMNIT